jgi:hypothetical protein
MPVKNAILLQSDLFRGLRGKARGTLVQPCEDALLCAV